MVEADFSGNFLNEDNTKNGDVIIILGEAKYEEKTNPMTKETFNMLNVPVEVNKKQYSFTPCMANGKELVKKWGKETKEWIGKKGTCEIVAYTSYGEKKRRVEIIPS